MSFTTARNQALSAAAKAHLSNNTALAELAEAVADLARSLNSELGNIKDTVDKIKRSQ
jgi:hypothetical protein